LSVGIQLQLQIRGNRGPGLVQMANTIVSCLALAVGAEGTLLARNVG
jgi:hypothetical protein